MNWIWIVVAPFGLAVTGLIVWGLLSELHEHTLYLYGRALEAPGHQRAIRLRLAVQNGEDVVLRSEPGGVWRIQLSIAPDGEFTADPRAFLGPRRLPAHGGVGRSVYWVEFHELPASDTWVFECEVDHRARALVLQVIEVQAGRVVQRRLRRLSNATLRVDLDRGAESEAQVRGSSFVPSGRFGFSSVGAALCIYGGTILALGSDRAGALVMPFRVGFDVTALVALAVLGAILFRFVLRPAPPLIQGYRNESPIIISKESQEAR